MTKKLSFLLALLIGCFSGLAGCNTKGGEFYSLGSAYEQNYLSKEDIRHVSYFFSGNVYELTSSEEETKINFKPQKELEKLSASMEKRIKRAYYNCHKEQFYRQNKKLGDEETIALEFYGQYSNSYVVRVNIDFISYGQGIYDEIVADVVISHSDPPFLVFVANS